MMGWLRRRVGFAQRAAVLEGFIDEIARAGSPQFAEMLSDMAAVYLLHGHLEPPVWSRVPADGTAIRNEY